MSLPPTQRGYTLKQHTEQCLIDMREVMHAYGQACREAALEEAAMAAEDGFLSALDGYQIADKIRSLK